MNTRRRHIWVARFRTAILSLVAWGAAAVIAFPIYWMVASSLKGPSEIISSHPTLWPRSPTLANYRTLFGPTVGFTTWVTNSCIVTACTVIAAMILGSLGAYSIARFRYPGRGPVALIFLGGYLLPPVLIVVPTFLVIARIGLANSLAGLILVYMTGALPLAVWLLRSHFVAISPDVENAALVDGSSRLSAYVQIVIPQVLPGIVSTAIFIAITTWSDYLFALVFLTSPSHYTLPLGIATYANAIDATPGPLMASATLATLPLAIVITILQRKFLRGFGLVRQAKEGTNGA